jgi:ABC-type Fe3+/spermidine/putrescine transport system ATPase subunit
MKDEKEKKVKKHKDVDHPKVDASRVEIRGAAKHYGTLKALNNFDLTIEPGTFTVLLGPSGSGKSTLIRSIAGIERLDFGKITFGDRVVADGAFHMAPEKRDLAMVFQDYALWPHMTAFENVAYALKRRNLDELEAHRRIHEALERVGLSAKGPNYPFQLSGGEQQRVALARAIVGRPSLLLFDEPLSNLDADLRERLRVEIATLTREIGATACYITHDQSEAFALADQIGVLRAGELQQIAAPEEIYRNPANRFVAAFTGISGAFQGTVSEVRGRKVEASLGKRTLECRTSADLSVGQSIEVLIRPSATSLDSRNSNSLPAIVLDVAYRGRGYEHVVECEFGVISSVFAAESTARGSKVEIYIDPHQCLAFPSEKSAEVEAAIPELSLIK